MEVEINFADVSPMTNSWFRASDRFCFQPIEGPHKLLDRFYFIGSKDFSDSLIFKDINLSDKVVIFFIGNSQSHLSIYSMWTVLFVMKAVHFELYNTLYYDW